MNKVIVTGRLTRDPEVRYTQEQKAVANFGIAVDRWKDGADFFNCTAFSKTAEHMEKYWKKGMKALISGRLQTESWTAKDGSKRTDTKIVVDEIEFCEPKGEKKEAPTEWAAIPAGDQEELPFNF